MKWPLSHADDVASLALKEVPFDNSFAQLLHLAIAQSLEVSLDFFCLVFFLDNLMSLVVAAEDAIKAATGSHCSGNGGNSCLLSLLGLVHSLSSWQPSLGFLGVAWQCC